VLKPLISLPYNSKWSVQPDKEKLD